MDTPKLYILPKLAYDYNALAPIISVQKAIFADGGQRRGLGLGSTHVL